MNDHDEWHDDEWHDDEWHGDEWRREPTLLDLRELERIGDRRAEIEAVEIADDGPAHRDQAAMRRLLLATLDEMEEALCLYGRRAPAVAEGWQRLARFESFGRDG